MSNEEKQYDKPMTFVNAKRVRTGDTTKSGAEKTVVTFGLVKNYKTGEEENSLDQLIAALEQYRGKQVNLNIFIQDKEDSNTGRTFQSCYVGVTEMIPKYQAQAKTAFVPKANAKAAALKAKTDKLSEQFKG